MTSALFIAGLAAFVVGLALVSIPAALMVGGTLASLLAVVTHRGLGRPKRGERA